MYEKTNWLPRIGTGLNKFRNSGSMQNLVLTPDPDSISQQGTPFSADLMNHLEEGVYQAHLLAGALEEQLELLGTAVDSKSENPSTSTSAPSIVVDNTIYTLFLSANTTIAIPASGMIQGSILRVTNADYITWSGATHYNGDEPASGEVWEFSVLNGSVIGVKLKGV